jgi:hypothetical protein
LRPARNFTTPIHAWATARFRSIAKAPCTPRCLGRRDRYTRAGLPTHNERWLVRSQFEDLAQACLGGGGPPRPAPAVAKGCQQSRGLS